MDYVGFGTRSPQRVSLVPLDPTSRYQAKQLIIEYFGKNKMLKTVLRNAVDVCKDMHCDQAHFVMFLAYELNCTPMLELQGQPGCSALAGNHSTETLSIVVQHFIESFLLCPVCGLPELDHGASKTHVKGKCRSCGSLSNLILGDKFTRYVLNHPPR
jgi:translation initiation factor 2 beta subunit (eIF-2beta)/eIF-5